MNDEAVIVGSHVSERLRARASGVFRRACYLSEGDRIAAVLLAEGVGPAPHGVVVPVPPQGFLAVVAPGSLVELSHGVLTVERDGAVRASWTLAGAERYSGAVWNGERARTATTSPEILGAVSGALSAFERTQRSGRLLAAAARARVARLVDELSRAVRTDDRVLAESAVARLVGLGPGLTPSGDDALVGFLAARWAAIGSGGIVAGAVGRVDADTTTGVSRSFLELAARGSFAEPLATLARAAANGDLETVRGCTRDCLALGATSGADGLAGLLGGYASLEPGDRTIQRGA